MKLATEHEIERVRTSVDGYPEKSYVVARVCETAEVARKLVAELRRVTRYGHQPNIVPCLCRACALLGTIEVSDE